VIDLCRYLGIEQYLLFTGIQNVKHYDKFSPVERLRHIYCAMNLHVSTSIGEGWGLTAMESMACGVLNALPSHSAFEEWAHGGAWLYPAPTTIFHPEGINTAGHIPDVDALARLMYSAYANQKEADRESGKGLSLVRKPEFKWSNVAKIFDRVFKEVTQ